MNKVKPFIKLFILLFLSFICFAMGRNEFWFLDVPYDDTARFIAGMPLPADSPLIPFTKSEYYKKYKTEIDESWNGFQGPNLEKIVKWRERNLRFKFSKTVLYPFSGPDIVHALSFYPKADLYIMFGLEPPGRLPDIRNMTELKINEEFDGLKKSLIEILKFNFFITSKMKEVISTNNFNGIIGVQMFLLARYKCPIINIKKIWIDSDGKIKDTKAGLDPQKAINGCEITFRYGKEEKLKKVQFFQVDVSDKSLPEKTNFLAFIKSYGEYNTLLKAASYLLHPYSRTVPEKNFSILRSIILQKSRILIQDDTGIPAAYFWGSGWDVRYYGYYEKPIPLFEWRLQENLAKIYESYSFGTLPFSYGYFNSPSMSNLMVAIAR